MSRKRSRLGHEDEMSSKLLEPRSGEEANGTVVNLERSAHTSSNIVQIRSVNKEIFSCEYKNWVEIFKSTQFNKGSVYKELLL
ncbi:unnamed protein product [Euphydryas editha]|uniref:Uncharacterized protein n=1 Tax=Euphydryas editha TaxID=104508 RepID=A0AAU9UNY3_EUPED|nr:unnamed protein product [Euphydryas editha]